MSGAESGPAALCSRTHPSPMGPGRLPRSSSSTAADSAGATKLLVDYAAMIARTPVSCLATPDASTCWAFSKESRMELARAAKTSRESGKVESLP